LRNATSSRPFGRPESAVVLHRLRLSPAVPGAVTFLVRIQPLFCPGVAVLAEPRFACPLSESLDGRA
jgi:hypothetical protein